jgi:protein TonB
MKLSQQALTNLMIAGGTAAIHILLLVVIDAGGQYGKRGVYVPAPRVELVDIEPPPPPPPPPPPVKPDDPPPPPPPKPAAIVKRDPTPRETTPPPPDQPPTPPPDPTLPPDPGGAPVVKMADVAPAARGVAVERGTLSRRIGRGGTGTGTGAGSGAGTTETPKPMSVATIKKRAMPRGDYSFDAAKDYPPAAKAQGIEGQIKVRLLVDATGKVAERRLLNKLGHGLDELALARAATFEFDPALDTDDRPVASVVVWTFTFTLPE